jgi:hypothetical protein
MKFMQENPNGGTEETVSETEEPSEAEDSEEEIDEEEEDS